jgi:hypothetical protein
MDKSVRWENIDLRQSNLSMAEIAEVRDHLVAMLETASTLHRPRIKKAIKAANSILHAPRLKNGRVKIGEGANDRIIGRYNGGAGASSFVQGGKPGSKR